METKYLYQESDLPKEGWLQACLICDTKTSRCIFYKTIKKYTKVYVHLCPVCTRKLSSSEFKSKYIEISEHILNNSPELQL